VKQFYEEPTFIVGMPRSGTTLIQGILCNTGKYFPIPETHFFSRVAYGLPEKLDQKARRYILRVLMKKSRIRADELALAGINTQKEAFEYVISIFNTKNQSTFLEKTPRHVFFYSKILKYYPSAKFICMIREPKNSVASQLTSSPVPNKSVTRLSFLYRKIAKAVINIQAMRNVFLIKYEDLTTDQESIVSKICSFLNIPYNSKFIENVAAPAGIVSEHEFWKQNNIDQQTIKKNQTDKWRNVLSPYQAAIVNFITGPYAKEFGYSLSYKPVQLSYGLFGDIPKLISKREIKKLFSNI